MPVGKKVTLKALVTLDLLDGLTVEDLLTEVEGVLQTTAEDYGNNVVVTIE